MIHRILNKKIPAWIVSGILVLSVLAGVAIAARYERLDIYKLYVREIHPWGGAYTTLSAASPQFTNANVGLADPINNKEGALTWASGTGFSMPAAGAGSLFTFNVTNVTDSSQKTAKEVGIAQGGVTIVLPAPTAATHLEEWTFTKMDAGTTKVVFYAGGLPIDTAAGTTNTNFDLDAIGDTVTLLPNYAGGVSFIVKSKNVH